MRNEMFLLSALKVVAAALNFFVWKLSKAFPMSVDCETMRLNGVMSADDLRIDNYLAAAFLCFFNVHSSSFIC